MHGPRCLCRPSVVAAFARFLEGFAPGAGLLRWRRWRRGRASNVGRVGGCVGSAAGASLVVRGTGCTDRPWVREANGAPYVAHERVRHLHRRPDRPAPRPLIGGCSARVTHGSRTGPSARWRTALGAAYVTEGGSERAPRRPTLRGSLFAESGRPGGEKAPWRASLRVPPALPALGRPLVAVLPDRPSEGRLSPWMQPPCP